MRSFVGERDSQGYTWEMIPIQGNWTSITCQQNLYCAIPFRQCVYSLDFCFSYSTYLSLSVFLNLYELFCSQNKNRRKNLFANIMQCVFLCAVLNIFRNLTATYSVSEMNS